MYNTAMSIVLYRVRMPRIAITAKSVAANGIISQVGAIPPNTLCQSVLMGAKHTKCGIGPRIIIKMRIKLMDLFL